MARPRLAPRLGPVIGRVLAVGALAALTATGGRAQPAVVQPPNVLPRLIGSWRFELGDRSGVRHVRPLYDDHAIEYRETVDGSDMEARGVITFDAAKGRYLSMDLHNRPGTAGASVGVPQGDGSTIVFRPAVADDDRLPTESWLIVESPDRFRYELREQVQSRWRLVWTAKFSRVLPRPWAGGTPGPHAVGLSTVSLDADRGEASLGRAIVWRPIEWPGPPAGLEGLSRRLCGTDASRATCFPELAVGSGGIDGDADSMPTATAGGTSIAGRQPLVLAVGSLESRGGEFVALAELLASHGLVVAEVLPPLGTSTVAFDDRSVASGVERLVRARAALAVDGGIDPARLAVLTWSFGGVPGTIVGCGSPPARAIVSLDAALGYRYGADLLRSRGFDATTCAAGLLSVRAGVESAVPTDHALVDRWAPGRVVRITAAGLSHGDFSDRHGALSARQRRDADAAAFRQRFGAVADEVVAYLVAMMRAP